MNIKKRWINILSITLLIVFITVVGCAPKTPETTTPETPAPVPTTPEASEPVRGDSPLYYRIYGDIHGFDPLYTRGHTDHAMADAIYDTLVKLKADDIKIIEPSLALNWQASDDAKLYTFQLRQGVKWHKGYGEFTAHDVKFHFDRLLDPASKSSHRSAWADIIDKVEVINDYEVRFHLKDSLAPFIEYIANGQAINYITSQAAFKDLGEKINETPIGTGPFVFEENRPGNRVILSPNEDYFQGAPKIPKLEFVIIADDNTAKMAFRAGEIDIDILRSDDDVNFYTSQVTGGRAEIIPLISQFVIYLNNKLAPFDDPRVRRAMLHAIDRQTLVDTILGDFGVVAVNGMPLGMPFYIPAMEGLSYDPEKAKQLLTEAGYPNGFTLEAIDVALDQRMRSWAMIQEYLRKVGIEVEVQFLERAAWIKATAVSESDVHMFSQNTSRGFEPSLFFGWFFHSDAFPPGGNGAQYDKIDDLLDEAVLSTDPKVREQLYQEAQRKIAEDVPVLPIFQPKVGYYTRDSVEGLNIYPLQLFLVNFSEASKR